MEQHPTGKKLVCIVATLLLWLNITATVAADGGHNPFEKEAGGYRVKLVVDEPVKQGSKDIVVMLSTQQGEPVDGAIVWVKEEQAVGHAEEESDHASDGHESDGHENMETTQNEGEPMEGMDSETHVDEHDKADAVTFEAGHEPGEYHGAIDLTKAGNWVVTVYFEVDHEENSVEFPVEVQPGFSKAGILSGFLGINVAAIASAAVLKRKQTAEKKAAEFAKKDGAAKKADIMKSVASDGTEKEL